MSRTPALGTSAVVAPYLDADVQQPPPLGQAGLDVRVRRDGGDLQIELHGALDRDAVAALEATLDAAEASDAECVLLDLRQLTFMDAEGLDTILDTHHRLNRDRALLLNRGPLPVQHFFQAAGVEESLFFLD